MSVNFNIAPGLNSYKKLDTAKKPFKPSNAEQPVVYEKAKKGSFDNSKDKLQKDALITAADLEFLYAAAMLAKAQILMEQKQKPVPEEIVTSSKRADECYFAVMQTFEEIQSKIADVKTNFENGEEFGLDGEITRLITESGEDGVQIMQEYDESGFLFRESKFKDGILEKIEEFKEDGTKDIIRFRKGQIEEYSGGVEEKETGIFKKEYLTFNKNMPGIYYGNYKEFNSGASYVGTGISFDERGKMGAYYEDMQAFEDGSSLIGLHLRYDDTLYEYVENIHTSFEEGMKIGKKLLLEDGQWIDKTP